MNPLIHQFNRFGQGNNLIQKALTTAANSGGALIPESLEREITDTIVRLSPELALMTPVSIASDQHKFNQLTARPAPGGAMGENATTPVTSSQSSRKTLDLKVIRRKGKVTGFEKDSSRDYIDALGFEMENQVQAQALDLIQYMTYGDADVNSYEFSGLAKFISTNRTNNSAGAVAPATLKFLDDMIDASNSSGGNRHRRCFKMSPQMLSHVSRLLTNVRLQQGGNTLTQVEIGGGWRLNAYRNIPIVETANLTAKTGIDPDDVTLGTAATGGGLSDGTYDIVVVPITLDGEHLGHTVKQITLSGGGAAQTITITLSDAFPGAYQYYIFGVTDPGDAVLIDIVPAKTYDSDGTITGDNGVSGSPFTILSMTPTAKVPSHFAGMRPLALNNGFAPESVILHDLNPIQGLGKMPYTNTGGSRMNGLITFENLAKTDDFENFLVKSFTGLTPALEKTSAWTRNLIPN